MKVDWRDYGKGVKVTPKFAAMLECIHRSHRFNNGRWEIDISEPIWADLEEWKKERGLGADEGGNHDEK